MADFDFSGVAGDVKADIDQANATDSQTPAQTPAPTGTTEQPPAGAASAAAATAQPTGQTTQQGEPLYDVKINGKMYRVPLSELQSGYSRTADYTQKTMALAQREREWNEYLQKVNAEYQRQAAILNDPRVRQYLQSLQAGTAPDEVPTTGQVQQLLQQQMAEAEQRMQQMQAQMAEELEVRNLASQYATEVDNTVNAALDRNPILKRVRGIDRLLREDVVERQPQSIEEAKRYIVEAATMRAQELVAEIQQQQTQQAVQQAQRLRGIEPPGGSIPPPPAAPTGKLGSVELKRAAIADLEAAFKK